MENPTHVLNPVHPPAISMVSTQRRRKSPKLWKERKKDAQSFANWVSYLPLAVELNTISPFRASTPNTHDNLVGPDARAKGEYLTQAEPARSCAPKCACARVLVCARPCLLSCVRVRVCARASVRACSCVCARALVHLIPESPQSLNNSWE